jgi:hypothetical protein
MRLAAAVVLALGARSTAGAQPFTIVHGRVVNCRSAGYSHLGDIGAYAPVRATVTVRDRLGDSSSTTTDRTGRFILLAPLSGEATLSVDTGRYRYLERSIPFDADRASSISAKIFLVPFRPTVGSGEIRAMSECWKASTIAYDAETSDRYTLR